MLRGGHLNTRFKSHAWTWLEYCATDIWFENNYCFFAIVLGLRLITAMGQIEKINWTRTEDVEVKGFFVLL